MLLLKRKSVIIALRHFEKDFVVVFNLSVVPLAILQDASKVFYVKTPVRVCVPNGRFHLR